MNKILNRLKAKTPNFFKIIINISISITTLSGLLLGSGLVLPDSVAGLITQGGIIAGIIAAFIAKLTVQYDIKDKQITYADTINPDTHPNPPRKEGKDE